MKKKWTQKKWRKEEIREILISNQEIGFFNILRLHLQFFLVTIKNFVLHIKH